MVHVVPHVYHHDFHDERMVENKASVQCRDVIRAGDDSCGFTKMEPTLVQIPNTVVVF